MSNPLDLYKFNDDLSFLLMIQGRCRGLLLWFWRRRGASEPTVC